MTGVSTSVLSLFPGYRFPGWPWVLVVLAPASGGGIYLEVAAAVTTFLLAGRFYEARARRSAAGAMRQLAAAAAKDVCLLGPAGTTGASRPADCNLTANPGGHDG